MSETVKKIRVKQQDGSMSEYIPIGSDAEYIDMADGDNVESAIARIKSEYAHYYDNIASMKNDTKLKEGDTAVTLGYYEINDGGNGTYKIRKITNNDIIDNITIIPLNYDNSLICELIINDIMYIEQFGVNGNDITTDSNYTNIAINTNVKTLIFNKNYTLKNIILKSNITFKGNGTITCNNVFGGDTGNNLAINKTNINIDGLTFNFNVSGKLYFKNCSNINIKNCKINSYSSGWNIKLLYCNNSYIDNNVIITNGKAYDDGIHVSGENIYITNNYVQNSEDISKIGGDDSIAIGVELNEEDLTKKIKNIVITNNVLKTVSRAINIYSHNQDISNIQITNNKCYGRLRISAESTQTKYLFKNINISDSSFENKNSKALYCALINCVDGLFINNCKFNTEYGDIIKIEKYINNIIFNNCQFTTDDYKTTNPQDYALINTMAYNSTESQLSLKLLNSIVNTNTKLIINGANDLTIKNNLLYSKLVNTILISVYNSFALKNMILSDNLLINPTLNQDRTLASINTKLESASLIIINNVHNFGSNPYFISGVITKTVINDNNISLNI